MTATEVRSGEVGPARLPVHIDRVAGGRRKAGSLRWRWPTMATAFGSALAVLGFAIGSRPIGDNSFLTHLATGRLMAETGKVPVTDPYSSDFAGEAWTVQSWLASAVYHGLDTLLGSWALPVFHGVLASALAAGIWVLVDRSCQLVTRMALVSVPLVLAGSYWSPRPLLIGLVGLLVVLAVVRRRLPLWALAPIMWIWVNSHGSFPLALVVVVSVMMGAAIDTRSIRSIPWSLGAWTMAGLVASGLNPLGPRLWWFPLGLLSSRDGLEGVVEWQTADFDSTGQLLYLALVVPLVVAARNRARWADLVPAVVFYGFGFLAIRNLAPASIVVVVMVAPALKGLVGSEIGDRRSPVAAAVAVLAAVGAAVGLTLAVIRPPLVFDRYPVDAVDMLQRQGLIGVDRDNGGAASIVHRDGVGNYLIHRYGRLASVFIDDRFDFYPLERTRAHVELLDGGDYAAVLDEVGADVVLWEAERQLARWLRESPAWEVSYEDEDWIVACRRADPVIDRCRG